ncbi:MAG: hypothetical protein HY369_02855 [Candidatus Aenigmarchaeota archaeon]|nr:hypothetical protein [Candidatus Aenigmarchaeota archaeon]
MAKPRRPRPEDEQNEDPYASDWRISLLRKHAARSVEDREYIIRTALLIEHLGLALQSLEGTLDSAGPTEPGWMEHVASMLKPFIDQVWRESHHGHPARVTAMALCHALNHSRTVEDVIPLLQLRGYVRLAETLDGDKVARVYAAWFDRSPGKKAGRSGKFTEIARLLRPVGIRLKAETIERLWRDDQGFGQRRRRRLRPPMGGT